jgi:enolase
MYDLDFKTAGNDGSQKLTGTGLKDLYKSFLEKYPIVSIEDPFDQVRALAGAPLCIAIVRWISMVSLLLQDDWATYTAMTGEVGVGTQVVGDDLLVTNPVRVAKAIEERACNALLLKVCGTSPTPLCPLRAGTCAVSTRVGAGQPDWLRHREH